VAAFLKLIFLNIVFESGVRRVGQAEAILAAGRGQETRKARFSGWIFTQIPIVIELPPPLEQEDGDPIRPVQNNTS
jgi:hypothetical protein